MRLAEPLSRPIARRALVLGVLVGSFLLVSLDLGLDHYGAPMDELAYHEASRKHVAWMLALGHDGSLSERTLAEHFAWAPETVIHPTFSRWLSGLSWLLFHGALGLDEIVSLRLHNAVAFALIALGVVTWTLRRYGAVTALFALLLTWTDVRLFGHAHTAQTDLVLTATWLWALLLAMDGVHGGSTRQLIAAALVAGAALSTKMTGLLLVGVLVAWPVWVQGKGWLRAAAWLLLVPPLVFFALNPQCWHHPIEWTSQWLADMRAREQATRIPSLFLAQRYMFRAPWFAAPVHALITTPPALLLLSATAGVAALRQLARVSDQRQLLHALREPWVLATLAGALPLVACMLPFVPNHDLERLFLPVHPCLILAAAHGFHVTTTWLAERASDSARWPAWTARVVLGTLVLAPTTYAAARAHPYELTYFNTLVGGPAGAQALGFDVPYSKLELNGQVLAAVDRLIEPNGELWSNFLQLDLRLHQQAGRLRSDIHIVPRFPARYVLVHGRRSWMMPFEERVMAHTDQAFWTLEHQGVVLIALFRFEPDR